MANETSKMIEVDGRKIKLISPTLGIGSEGDLEFSKAYTKALQAGLMPRAAMEKLSIDSGAWTTKDDEEVTIISNKLQDVMAAFLVAAGEEKDKLRLEFYDFRNRLAAITAKRQSLFTHTAEAKGEEAKIASLAWKCILNEDGSKVWKSLEEFFSETNIGFVSQAVQSFVAFTSGLEEKIEEIEKIFDKVPEETKEVIPEVEETKAEEPKV